MIYALLNWRDSHDTTSEQSYVSRVTSAIYCVRLQYSNSSFVGVDLPWPEDHAEHTAYTLILVMRHQKGYHLHRVSSLCVCFTERPSLCMGCAWSLTRKALYSILWVQAQYCSPLMPAGWLLSFYLVGVWRTGCMASMESEISRPFHPLTWCGRLICCNVSLRKWFKGGNHTKRDTHLANIRSDPLKSVLARKGSALTGPIFQQSVCPFKKDFNVYQKGLQLSNLYG